MPTYNSMADIEKIISMTNLYIKLYCVPLVWLGTNGSQKACWKLAKVECTCSYMLGYLPGYLSMFSIFKHLFLLLLTGSSFSIHSAFSSVCIAFTERLFNVQWTWNFSLTAPVLIDVSRSMVILHLT